MLQKKNKWLGVGLLFLVLSAAWAMKPTREKASLKAAVSLEGKAQGTTYHIKYLDAEERNFQQEVDSIFLTFDRAFSAWLPESEINTLNREEAICFASPYFFPVLVKSREVYEKTGGAFDPTIAPLVRAWGFGPDGVQQPPSDGVIDSLKPLLDFRGIRFDRTRVQKPHKGVQLDFNAVAPGYTVDVLASFFKEKGISNLFIELGGEVYASGVNERGKSWRVGINTPSEKEAEQMDIKLILPLTDRAITTSGNYRRFYEKDGVKYAHTISPFTGKPVQHSLLSATVLARDCMTADAYATAFMVLGLEKAIAIVKEQQELEVILIYDHPERGMQTYISPELSRLMLKNEFSKR